MSPILGIGGGVFLIPFLLFVIKIPIHQAIATSLVTVIATSSAAASVNVGRQLANIPLGMTLELTTTIGAILGGVTAGLLQAQVLHLLFGILLVIVAIFMMLRLSVADLPITSSSPGALGGRYYDPLLGCQVSYGVRRLPLAMAISLLAGNISGLLGVGGGVIKVPALTLICGIPIKAATATSNFMIGVTAVASAFIYYARGQVEPVVTAATVLGVLAGSALGTRVLPQIKSRWIVLLFFIVLLVLATEMMMKGLKR
ncbi:MAG: sulfite exporter TauE/SafE family protein [candidate division KSB1 bacterium]|nr:sulfite exporter TauE/SafE family protein [candidate division KSB1 bacterium]